MSIKIIQERLDAYHCTSDRDEQQAMREISQEVALMGLSRSGFFQAAAFQGGTCLRVLYSLERFSEDLDFVLMKATRTFHWKTYLKGLTDEFAFYGYEATIQDRSTVDETVKKAFLKDDSIGQRLHLRHRSLRGRPKTIRIKLEIDVNPPTGSNHETRYLDFPLPFSVTVQDLPSLFASKCHALLCREYVKGRDWYDFLWYTARKVPINFKLLQNALDQQGPWKQRRPKVEKNWLLQELGKKIQSIDWAEAKRDTARFVKQRELQTLELWSTLFFLDRAKKLAFYL